MPDLTPKPLRSKANAVINLMGAAGGIFTLVTIRLLVTGDGKPDYMPVFISVAALMVAAVIVLLLTVREREQALPPEKDDSPAQSSAAEPKKKMPAEVKKSFILILCSIFLWFMGYNAVTSAFTKYAQESWGLSLGAASACLLVATGAAVLSYIPVGFLSARLGRKKVILGGVFLLSLCFGISSRFTQYASALAVLFALVGVSWAAINVNSYPMVVEMGKAGDTGKYTGYYYTFSMAAQIVTPILSGALLEHVGYWTLFPYAAVMVAASFGTMLFVRHGDNRPGLPQSKLEMFNAD